MGLGDIRRTWRKHQQDNLDVDADLRVGLAGTFTLDPLIPYLGVSLMEAGLSPSIKEADYNQIVQTCLDPDAAFGQPVNVIVLVWRLEDIADLADTESANQAVDMIVTAVAQLRSNFSGTIIVSLPPHPFNDRSELTQFAKPTSALILSYEVSLRIISALEMHDDLYFLNLEKVLTHIGHAAHDDRKRLLYRQPYSEEFYHILGEHTARIVRARKYEPKKCIVMDCDNTLWKGIVGEDGLGGILMGQDFPGNTFREVQQQIKHLSASGIFVALSSKNNEQDVWEVFDRHEDMVLKRDDISVARINWSPKSQNLKEIASELNIGLDALVFVDDNPFEIDEVRTNAPEVTCFQVPDELSDYAKVVSDFSRLFDRLVITADDTARVERMRGEAKRKTAPANMTQEEYISQLQIKTYVYEARDVDLARVTQLINKTNQFNCTTRRRTLDEVKSVHKDEAYRLYCLSVSDKFGEYGLVGVAILRIEAEVCHFDTLLMSCRVLGRGVETAFMAQICKELAAENILEVVGDYVPTAKNNLVKDLFERHSFEKGEAIESGERWRSEIPLKCAPPIYLAIISSPPHAGAE